MWTTETTRDALVKIDDTPCWVRLSAVQAVLPWSFNKKKTEIQLASGLTVTTDTPVDDVVDRLSAAMRNTKPTFGGT